jgi:hypothetical protein
MLLSKGALASLPDLDEILPTLVEDPVVSGEMLLQSILLNRLTEKVAPVDSTIIISE